MVLFNKGLIETIPISGRRSQDTGYPATVTQLSDIGGAASFTMSGSGVSNASNLLSPNNSEEPLPLELHSVLVLTQVSTPHSVMTCVHMNSYVCVCVCVSIYALTRLVSM